MRIFYLITGLGVGGAEVITIDLANSMRALGHEVKIEYMTNENALENRVNAGIEVHCIDIKKNPISFLKGIIRLKKQIKKFKPDVVHAHMFHANIFARITRLFTSIPKLICTAHNKNEGGDVRMLLYRLTDKLSDLNTNVSEEAVDCFIQKKAFSKKNSICMYNGISLDKFKKDTEFREKYRKESGFANDDFVFITVGRLTKAKDHVNLLHAFKQVNDQNNKTKLIIVGEGEERKNIESLIEELKLTDKVYLMGIKPNVEVFYNMSDCFVLSSAWEGFGIVLAEAMACELPVITTDAGGCAEVVSQPEWVIPTYNSVLLAEKMIIILNKTKEEREMMGRINRELVNRFDIKKIVDSWETIYKNN